MVTDLSCWWKNQYIGDFIDYAGDIEVLLICYQNLKSVINI